MTALEERVERFRRRCAGGGLDLVHPFSLARLDPELRARLRPARPDALGLVVANGAALWDALAARAPHADDPVDRLVESTIEAAASGSAVHYAHREGPDGYLPIQRIAAAAGFAPLGPCHLAIHPERGPWVALRAVVVLDEPWAEALAAPSAEHPCDGCEQPCMTALARAEDWRGWLAVRDACPVGREHRYGEAQIAYHYTKDRRHLPTCPNG